METTHRVRIADSRDLTAIRDDAVDLVVTSPPYPMIEMWDEVFSGLNSQIGECLARDDGQTAFELMHRELSVVWEEVARVLRPGGIACINIGDATRTLNDRFRVYHNHTRVVDAFESLGFDPLPDVLWRKPVNSTTKFLGSGMLPPNAYSTLEHEYILIFRNGPSSRSFEPGAEHRYNAAYFWEERNEWLSDMWLDVTGTFQELQSPDLRDRSGAFPFEIPFRLVNMYSVYGDVVLDPFLGTGTTSLAAMVTARNSIGYELEETFLSVFEERVSNIMELTDEIMTERIRAHQEFVRERERAGESLGYVAENYSFPVMTSQETRIKLYTIMSVEQRSGTFTVEHRPLDERDLP